MVVTQSERVANWASPAIRLGPGSSMQPFVLRPSVVPVIVELDDARLVPELAVLSAMVHGGGSVDTAVRVALSATAAAHELGRDRFMLYFDLVYRALSQAAKEAFRMDPQGGQFFSEEFQRSFSKGKATAVLRVLEQRGMAVSDVQRARILECADADALDHWLDKALTVTTADELFI